MTEDLTSRSCVPCHGGTPRLRGAEIEPLVRQLVGWQVIDEHHLEKKFEFRNFDAALRFTNRVGEVAEQEGHHPDICLGWGYAHVRLWTHAIDGLSESDFILAAKIDVLTEAEGVKG